MADAPAHLEDELDDEDASWPPLGETPADRAARIAGERVMIEDAREDIRQGRFISGQAAEDWLRKWAAGEPLPEDDEI